MTQQVNSQDKKNGSPPASGARPPATAAAQGALPASGARPPDAAAAQGAAPAAGAASTGAAAAEKPKKKRVNKVYIVVGQVSEFETPLQAENWINSEEGPKEAFVVIRGTQVKSKQKVTLR